MSKKAARRAVLLPIRKQHAANIYAGTKTVELRKTVPLFDGIDFNQEKNLFRVYMYESKADGGAGAITGFFTCTGYVGACKDTPEEKYPEYFAQRAQVTREYVENYGGGGWLYGWEVRQPTRLPAPVPLSALGITRAPQSWRYLNAAARSILQEVAARGSPAK